MPFSLLSGKHSSLFLVHSLLRLLRTVVVIFCVLLPSTGCTANCITLFRGLILSSARPQNKHEHRMNNMNNIA